MSMTPQVIALAGAGDLGRYVCEELLASDQFHVVVLTRGVRAPAHHGLHLHLHSLNATPQRNLQD